MKEQSSTVVMYTGKTELAPHYASEHAAGADLKADIDGPLSLQPGERALIPTGIHMAIPHGFEGQVRPRSGLAFKKGITVLNSPGTIDSDYRGEVKVILINLGLEPATIEPGERIAQLVIAEVSAAIFKSTEVLPSTDRGAGGFGSTGT